MALTSVVMDKAEQLTFVGGVNGKIAQVNLFLQVNMLFCTCCTYIALSFFKIYTCTHTVDVSTYSNHYSSSMHAVC